MKIGVFDSGLGGVVVTQSFLEYLPQYDYMCLGDTLRVPYGDRSQEEVYQFTLEAVDYLFSRDCGLVILACNTASAEALRKIQMDYLPAHYPERRVLGVLIPAAEEAVAVSAEKRIGVLATNSTVASGAYVRELLKLDPEVRITQVGAPELVPLIEAGELSGVPRLLTGYLAPFLDAGVDTLILGCTHYAAIKGLVREVAGPGITVISQDELVPKKLSGYLDRHPEIGERLGTGGSREFEVTGLARQGFTQVSYGMSFTS